MNDCEDFTKIIEDDNNLEKEKKYDSEVQRYNKQNIIINIIKCINIDKLDLPIESKNNIKKCVENLYSNNFTKLENQKVLGIDNLLPNELSYLEKKAIKTEIWKEISTLWQTDIKFMNNILETDESVFHTERLENEIYDLETKRKKLYQQLIDVKLRKIQLMDECAEKKFNSSQERILELLYKEYKVQQKKASFFENIVLQHCLLRTQHTTKAIQEIANHINEISEKKS